MTGAAESPPLSVSKNLSGGLEGPQALQSEFVSPGFAGRAGSLRPWAQTFLKLLAEKAAAGGLFRQTEGRRNRRPFCVPATPSGGAGAFLYNKNPPSGTRKAEQTGRRYRTRSSPQKNRATVPGPVWLPMVVPMLLISTLPLSLGKRSSTRRATACASSMQAELEM